MNDKIELFFRNISELQGRLYHLDLALKKYSVDYVQRMRNLDIKNLNSVLNTALVVNDISEPKDKGYIHGTNGQFSISLHDYIKETEYLIKRESAFTIAQLYEHFERFLKDIIAEYFYEKPDIGNKILSLNSSNTNYKDWSYLDWRSYISHYRPKGKNKYNKQYFEIIRTISVFFAEKEIGNNRKLHLSNYYKVWSEVRHGITHQTQEVTIDCYNGFNKIEKQLFDFYFPSTKGYKSYILEIDYIKANENIRLIAEYAFLIYKSISMELGIEWKKMLKNYVV